MARATKKNTRRAEDSPEAAPAEDRAEAQRKGAPAVTAAPDQDPAAARAVQGTDGGGEAVAAAAPPPEGLPKAPTGTSGAYIEVLGPKRGFRRAGRSFGPQPVRIAMSELTQDELTRLVEEPMLIVTVAPDPN